MKIERVTVNLRDPSFVTEVASLRDAPARVREAVKAGRIADMITRAANERADLVAAVLAGDGPIPRLAVEEALTLFPANPSFRMRNGASGGPEPADCPRPRACDFRRRSFATPCWSSTRGAVGASHGTSNPANAAAKSFSRMDPARW